MLLEFLKIFVEAYRSRFKMVNFCKTFPPEDTLLAEAFPLCFSALYCHSLCGFGCPRFVLVVCFGCFCADLCRPI